MRTRSVATGLLLASLLAALAPAGILAAKPVSEVRNERWTDSFVDDDTCPGLEILVDGDLRRSRTNYFDRDGALTRTVIHVVYQMSFTNLANDVTMTTPGTRHIELDYANNTFSDTGVYRNVTATGEGNVLHQTGRWLETLDEEELIRVSGPHEDWAGKLEEFCAALG